MTTYQTRTARRAQQERAELEFFGWLSVALLLVALAIWWL